MQHLRPKAQKTDDSSRLEKGSTFHPSSHFFPQQLQLISIMSSVPKQMKSLRTAPDHKVAVETVATPQPQDNEVLVKVQAVSSLGSVGTGEEI